MKALIALVLIAALGAGAYFAYDYVKRKPPAWLVELVAGKPAPPPLPGGDIAPFTVPEGFMATIYARDLDGPRVMTRDPKGAMLVSLTKAGKVVALPDLDGNGVADRTVTVLENLKQPHGIAVICPDTGNASADQDGCVLYVAETGALKTYAYDADTYGAAYKETLAAFPTGDGHFTRTLLQHPDGEHLLISVGSSCNVCDETSPLRATVQSLSLTDNSLTTFAKGLRNTVFMAVHPVTGEIWGTDNGRDLIGDDIPPDDVNVIKEGGDYGWPICYGNRVHDTDFDKKQYFRDPCADTVPPVIALQAHSAALGLAFVPEEGWPEAWWHDLLVAYHGSWNRSVPTGYKVVRFDLSPEGVPATGTPIDVMTGFLPEGAKSSEPLGRPAGLLVEPGGVMYVSDDHAGAIYRVSLTAPAM
jgi:glucose/arabinose dehydrogenase